jgi:hypothetical protein
MRAFWHQLTKPTQHDLSKITQLAVESEITVLADAPTGVQKVNKEKMTNEAKEMEKQKVIPLYQQYFLEAFLRDEAQRLLNKIDNDEEYLPYHWQTLKNVSYFFASDFSGASWLKPNCSDEHAQEKLKPINVATLIPWNERCQLAADVLNKEKPTNFKDKTNEFVCRGDWSGGWYNGSVLLYKKIIS